METIKGTLDGKIQIEQDAVYLVDFSKMQNVEELLLLLSAVGFSFSPSHPHFDKIQHLLALDRPIKIGGQRPEAKELNLPKLKAIKPNGAK